MKINMKIKMKQNLIQIGIKAVALIMLVIMLSMFPIQSFAFENFFINNIIKVDDEEEPEESEYLPLFLKDYKESASKGQYFYKGIPEGHFASSNLNIFKWLVNFFFEITDYLLGLVASVFNMGVLGWGILAEVLLSEAFNSLTVRTKESGTYRKNNAEFYTDSKRTVNIENILFNRVEVLNVNFFESKESVKARLQKYGPTGLDLEELYGEEPDFNIDEDAPLLVIKDYFAFIFLILYGVGLLLLLVALIINAIMATIESVAVKKVTYKERAKSWGKAFIEMLILVVYMIAILQIHTTVINMLSNLADAAAEAMSDSIIQTDMGRNYTILETLRTRAYSLKLTVGVPATIMYLVLIWYTFKFVLMYLKRFLVVFFLSLLGPLLMIYDLIIRTIKGKSNVRTDWIKEYTFNVLIQVIHAFVYLIFIPITYALASKSLIGFLIMFILLKFLLEADKIIRQIFSIRGAKRHSILDNVLEKSTLKDYASGLVVGSLLGKDSPIGSTIGKYTSKAIAPIKAVAGEVGSEIFRGAYNLREYTGERTRARRIASGLSAETEGQKNRQKKKDQQVEDILKLKGYSDQEIRERMDPSGKLALTEEQKDRLRLLDSSKLMKTNMLIRGLRKAEYNSNRFKRVAKDMGTVDEQGRRRIKGREYYFDFNEKKIKATEGVHDKFRNSVIKEFNMGSGERGREEYRRTIDDFKKAGTSGLKAVTGILLFPISFVDSTISTGLYYGLIGNFQFNSKAFQHKKGASRAVEAKVVNNKIDVKIKKESKKTVKQVPKTKLSKESNKGVKQAPKAKLNKEGKETVKQVQSAKPNKQRKKTAKQVQNVNKKVYKEKKQNPKKNKTK